MENEVHSLGVLGHIKSFSVGLDKSSGIGRREIRDGKGKWREVYLTMQKKMRREIRDGKGKWREVYLTMQKKMIYTFACTFTHETPNDIGDSSLSQILRC
ncbi:hypothetical protein HAX54_050240 [Datura stramonium]|uniref:Uncharacterized protein n=1 Tax=Datura stramonium TaxID=4076 RepID=A0ABS8SWR6_DATST|nr:hypothetical protein [Datura stramonium]